MASNRRGTQQRRKVNQVVKSRHFSTRRQVLALVAVAAAAIALGTGYHGATAAVAQGAPGNTAPQAWHPTAKGPILGEYLRPSANRAAEGSARGWTPSGSGQSGITPNPLPCDLDPNPDNTPKCQGNGSSPNTGNMTYHGGSVMHKPVAYAVYWLPSGNHYTDANTAAQDTSFENDMNTLLTSLSVNNFWGIVQQYTDGGGAPGTIPSFGGSWTDTAAYPHAGTNADPLGDGDIQNEVHNAATTNSWTEDANHEYFVFLGGGIQECDGSSSNCTFNVYCAYHSSFTDGSKSAVYGFVGDDHGCDTSFSGSPSVHGKQIDGVLTGVSHEFIESVTDPFGNAWNGGGGGDGQEIGDKCNNWPGPRGSVGSDLYLGTSPFLLQREWSNAMNGCYMDLCGSTDCPPASLTFGQSPDASDPAGGTFHDSISVTNPSDTNAASEIRVIVNLPTQFLFSSANPPPTSQTGQQLEWDSTELAVHDAQSISLTGSVVADQQGSANTCALLQWQDQAFNPQTAQQVCGSTTITDSDLALGPLPANITADASSSSGAAVTYTTPTASDPDDPAPPAVVCSPGSGTTFPVGTTTVTCTASDSGDSDSPVSGSFTVTVYPVITVTAVNPGSLTEGSPFSGKVASVTSANPADTPANFTATITWGDGTTTSGVALNSDFSVSGSHTYAEEGPYTLVVTVSNNTVPGDSASSSFNLIVADAALSSVGTPAFSAPDTFIQTLATFADADPNGMLADYTATVTWGDGSSTTGRFVSLSVSGTSFAVSGYHTYARDGTYSIGVTVTDAGGSMTSTTTKAVVKGGPPAQCDGYDQGDSIASAILVRGGAVCTLVDSNVNGHVQVARGGTLILYGSVIKGDVSSRGGLLVVQTDSAGLGTHINGQLQQTGGPPVVVLGATIDSAVSISGEAASATPNVFCNDTVGGDLQVTSNAAPSAIGEPLYCGSSGGNNIGHALDVQRNDVSAGGGAFGICANAVGDDLQVTQNSGNWTIAVGDSSVCGPGGGNAVSGDLIVQQNTIQLLVSDNEVGGNLSCAKDNPVASGIGGSNTVAGAKQGECANL